MLLLLVVVATIFILWHGPVRVALAGVVVVVVKTNVCFPVPCLKLPEYDRILVVPVVCWSCFRGSWGSCCDKVGRVFLVTVYFTLTF